MPFRTFLLIMSKILSMSACLGKNYWINWVISVKSFNSIGS